MEYTQASLSIILSRLHGFDTAQDALEQYITPSANAAEFLWPLREQIQGAHVIDLGCGTGILGLGALILGAKRITCVDVDISSLTIMRDNYQWIHSHLHPKGNCTILHKDITHITTKGDLVITNPPFGTRTKHSDMRFLEKARQCAPIIASIHKTTTTAYIIKTMQQHCYALTMKKDVDLQLKNTRPHHTRSHHNIKVSYLYFTNFENAETNS